VVLGGPRPGGPRPGRGDGPGQSAGVSVGDEPQQLLEPHQIRRVLPELLADRRAALQPGAALVPQVQGHQSQGLHPPGIPDPRRGSRRPRAPELLSATSGRPRLTASARQGLVGPAMIGVDFGGTGIKAGIVEDGRVVRSVSTPTPRGAAPEVVLDTIARTVLELDPAPRSVGVAIPGEVDPTGRCWGLPNVPGFKGVQLGKGLSDRLRCPVAVENDATTAALGEYLYGHGTRYPSFLMITLGTGIGGGLVIGGQLYPGSNGFAGEIG